MSTKNKKIDRGVSTKGKKIDTRQMSILFDSIKEMEEIESPIFKAETLPGCLSNLESTTREMLSKLISESGMNRYGFAYKLSEILGKDITKTMLDAYLTESKPHNMPFIVIVAASIIAGDSRILSLVCKLTGGAYIEGEETIDRSLSKISKLKQDLRDAEKLLILKKEMLNREIL